MEENKTTIDDYCDIIKGIYRNYLKKPTWEKVQCMMRNVLMLGIEIGKLQAIQNFENTQETKASYIPPKHEIVRKQATKTLEYLDINGFKEKSFICADYNDARKLFDRLRNYVKSHDMNILVTRKGNKVKIERKI